MTFLTENETKVMAAIEHNNYGDGDGTYSDCINDSSQPSGVTGPSLSGVVSSLTKKGLVEVQDMDPGYASWINVTDKGRATYAS